MSYQFAISEIGLRLIKAYEGFRPEGLTTREGRKIVGYGRITDDHDLKVSELDAEKMLKIDLENIEALVNTHVHAALSQSQFDALCSLIHSIGADAFLQSDILHSLNRGEVISAANGFDGWRLGNIAGKTYVVDALVRRRTAEKALFLRPPLRTVPAPHTLVKAYRDPNQIKERVSSISESTASNQLASSNIITLYERDEIRDSEMIETKVMDLSDSIISDDSKETYTSPIAEAAAEVSERLDALMETQDEVDTKNWPDSLVEDDKVEQIQDEYTFSGEQTTDVVIDYLDSDDALRENIAETDYSNTNHSSADHYIEPAQLSRQQNLWAYITMIIFGLTAAGAGLWASVKGTHASLGDLGPLLSSAAVALGVLLSLMGLYYLMKHLFGRS